ncbi:MAG: hypothetical protein GC131_03745 [Alphaproteobacteria bacterium]|nr:hypothetical protein [Alphaproteobacteria bacterium]
MQSNLAQIPVNDPFSLPPLRYEVSEALGLWLDERQRQGTMNFAYAGSVNGLAEALIGRWGIEPGQVIREFHGLVKTVTGAFYDDAGVDLIELWLGEKEEGAAYIASTDVAAGVVLCLDIPVANEKTLALMLVLRASGVEIPDDITRIQWLNKLQGILDKKAAEQRAQNDKTNPDRPNKTVTTASIYDLAVVQAAMGNGLAVIPGTQAAVNAAAKHRAQAKAKAEAGQKGQVVQLKTAAPAARQDAVKVSVTKTSAAAKAVATKTVSAKADAAKAGPAAKATGASLNGIRAAFSRSAGSNVLPTTRPGAGVPIMRALAIRAAVTLAKTGQTPTTPTAAAAARQSAVSQVRAERAAAPAAVATATNTATAAISVAPVSAAVSATVPASVPSTVPAANAATVVAVAKSDNVLPFVGKVDVPVASVQTQGGLQAQQSVVSQPVTGIAASNVVVLPVAKADGATAMASVQNVQAQNVSAPAAPPLAQQVQQQASQTYTPPQTVVADTAKAGGADPAATTAVVQQQAENKTGGDPQAQQAQQAQQVQQQVVEQKVDYTAPETKADAERAPEGKAATVETAVVVSGDQEYHKVEKEKTAEVKADPPEVPPCGGCGRADCPYCGSGARADTKAQAGASMDIKPEPRG